MKIKFFAPLFFVGAQSKESNIKTKKYSKAIR